MPRVVRGGGGCSARAAVGSASSRGGSAIQAASGGGVLVGRNAERGRRREVKRCGHSGRCLCRGGSNTKALNGASRRTRREKVNAQIERADRVGLESDNSTDTSNDDGMMRIFSRCGERVAAAAASLALSAAVFVGCPAEPAAAATSPPMSLPPLLKLTAANPISNPNSLLRYALPIPEDSTLKQIQDALESIREDLRVPGVRFSGVSKSVNKSAAVLSRNRDKIAGAVKGDASRREEANKLMDSLASQLDDFKVIVENTDRQAVPVQQQLCLSTVGSLEELMVNEFPFEVPAEFANLPLLKGRATVEVKVKYTTHVPTETTNETMEMVLDGFNAPVTSGNFVDLVQRKFYDGMKVQRADGFVVQTGDPDGPADGFVDPSTEKIRTIPFELRIKGDKAPEYEFTVEDLGRPTEEPVLPFNAYGTLAMARVESDANSASSQIFWLLKESEVTPSNTNILDGNYAVFGYVVRGSDVLRELQVGDVIESVKVTKGIENLVNPSYKTSLSSVIAVASPTPAPPPAAEETTATDASAPGDADSAETAISTE